MAGQQGAQSVKFGKRSHLKWASEGEPCYFWMVIHPWRCSTVSVKSKFVRSFLISNPDSDRVTN